MSKRSLKYPWNRVPTCQRTYRPCAVENVSSRTVPVSGLECSEETISSSVTKISVFATEILATGPAGAFSYEHIKNFLEKRVARRDLGNRARPVDRAHMKRPFWDVCETLDVGFNQVRAVLSNFARQRVTCTLCIPHHTVYPNFCSFFLVTPRGLLQ